MIVGRVIDDRGGIIVVIVYYIFDYCLVSCRGIGAEEEVVFFQYVVEFVVDDVWFYVYLFFFCVDFQNVVYVFGYIYYDVIVYVLFGQRGVSCFGDEGCVVFVGKSDEFVDIFSVYWQGNGYWEFLVY